MSGTSISIDLMADGPVAALKKLDAALANPSSLMSELGEYELDSTKGRFKTMTAPDGTPWAPLSSLYKESKPRNRDKILTLNGYLRSQMRWQPDGQDALLVGSNLPYARIHQEGGVIKPKNAKALRIGGSFRSSATIPARRYLGLSKEDRREIVTRTMDWLSNQMGR